MQQQELDLRREAQRAEIELRRLALDRADENEKTTIQRLRDADRARTDFAHRGQTYAMWLAGSATGWLIAPGLAVVFLTVVGAVASSVGIALATLLLAAGLIASISNLVKNFLPGRSDDEKSLPPGGSDDSADSA
jgi:Flp pilus assembly protein TadB